VQVEAADLRRGDVDVVRTREVVVIGRPEEAETVRQGLQHPLPEDHAVLLGLGIEDGEDQVLLTQAGRALDVESLGNGRKIVYFLFFKFL